MFQDKSQFLATQANQEDLTQRNLVLREKLNTINENVKHKANLISDKHLIKLLGFKTSIKNFEENLNYIELKLTFSKGSDNHYVKFLYDTVTDDYDRKF